MKIASKRIGQELYEVSQKATSAQMREALQNQGVAILDNALDVFCDSGRTREQGRVAVDDLLDLKRALKEHVSQQRLALPATIARVESEIQSKFEPRPAGTVRLDNETNLRASNYLGTYRTNAGETFHRDAVRQSDFKGVSKFLADLSAIQGLYAAVAMVPGPLSASVKSIPKSMQTSHLESEAELKSKKEATSVGLPFFNRVRESTDMRQTVSERADASTLTADEQVIPRLLELKERLLASDLTAPQILTVEGHQNYEVHREYWEPKTIWGKFRQAFSLDVPEDQRFTFQHSQGSGTTVRKLGEVLGEESTLRIPTKSIT